MKFLEHILNVVTLSLVNLKAPLLFPEIHLGVLIRRENVPV